MKLKIGDELIEVCSKCGGMNGKHSYYCPRSEFAKARFKEMEMESELKHQKMEAEYKKMEEEAIEQKQKEATEEKEHHEGARQ